ncbi:choline/ethanolamine kinase [Stagonosporopsis vannaccii]|nr:choline/ethanolamine kinase [Stagonosporopsis vannaccii]
MASSNEQRESSELPRNNTVEGSTSPRASTKVVSFPDEGISPLMIAKHKELEQKDYLDLDRPSRHYPASISGKRLSGRPSIEHMGSFKPQSQSGEARDGNPSLTSLLSDSSNDQHHAHAHERLVKHVHSWLKAERTRRATRKAKRKAAKDARHVEESTVGAKDQLEVPQTSRDRSGSESSDGSVALDQLSSILEKTLNLTPADAKRKINHVRRMSTGLKRHSAISQDSDYFDSIDQLVPSCDVVLDNSKTMAYSIDEADADSEPDNEDTERRRRKEKEAWTTFRYEILRLAHTLKLKGWRRVALEQHDEIDVQRLSGALTNAVYVVSPPKNVKPKEERADGVPVPKNPPAKLLLRVYGPQVDHLIDRDSELQILQRLGRKRIGPRMLGTFKNGRFEEFFHAKPLSFKELRVPETSRQIAKRMRELHEGIDLLKSEREAGPFVWQNWDKWVDRCEQVVTWLDEQILEHGDAPITSASDRWRKRGLICGVEWPVFRQMIEKYRRWLEEQYGGLEKINERMVFAHNDTQYGNILRMMPEGESPLLLPANQHKQLVVIDFEYSNANVPGMEFANHFTEWCYNYHDPDYPWACASNYYPTPEEQHRFIRAYLTHSPGLKTPGGASSNPPTPHLGPLPSSASTTALTATAAPSTISAFMLDSRAPPGQSYQEQEAQAERDTEEEARRLMAETKLWRIANSAMWVAWGIVQAHVPGLPDFDAVDERANGNSKIPTAAALDGATAGIKTEAEAEEQDIPAVSNKESEPKDEAKLELDQDTDLFKSQEDEEFDYLAYSQDRAMFVWGDLVGMGLVKKEELPEALTKRMKIVEY